MGALLTWFLSIELLGLLALPVVFALFRRLPDRGITLAKPAALVVFPYALWLLATLQIAPNHWATIWVLLLLGGAAGWWLLRDAAAGLPAFLRANWRVFAAAELVFIALFLLWAWVASASPAINHTEKPMDLMFLNAVGQAPFFPPEDGWLSGHPVSYYYFGYLVMAFLGKLSGVASAVGYNLAVASVPALAGIGLFGLLYNLVRLSGGGMRAAIGGGVAAALLLLLAGNLVGALEFAGAMGWGGSGFWQWVGIKDLGPAEGAGGVFPDQPWWWWRSSRVIDTLQNGQSLDYTITEFPAFSYVLGDLHPHMMSLPFLLLPLSLMLNLYQQPPRPAAYTSPQEPNPAETDSPSIPADTPTPEPPGDADTPAIPANALPPESIPTETDSPVILANALPQEPNPAETDSPSIPADTPTPEPPGDADSPAAAYTPPQESNSVETDSPVETANAAAHELPYAADSLTTPVHTPPQESNPIETDSPVASDTAAPPPTAERLGFRWLARRPAQGAAAALFIGVLGMLNTWDLPVYAALFAAVLLAKAYRDSGGNLGAAVAAALSTAVPIVLLAVVLFAAFYSHLDGQVSGAAPLRGVATRPLLLLLALGLPLLPAAVWVLGQLRRLRWPGHQELPAAGLLLALAALPLLLWLMTGLALTLLADGAGAAFSDLGRRAPLTLAGAALFALAGYAALQQARAGAAARPFVLLLAAAAFYLLVGAELFYVVDAFGGAYRRMNTVFKVYYQVWPLLGIAAVYAVFCFADGLRPRRSGESSGAADGGAALRWGRRLLAYGGAALLGLLLLAALYFPVGAIMERSGGAGAFSGNTLDGLAFVQDASPGEYAAIVWLRDEAPDGRLVEAVGRDYSDYGRISAATGRPALLGWKGHERQWRSSPVGLDAREEAVGEIYAGVNPQQAQRLLDEYGIRYIYLGQRERAAYGVADLSQFGHFLKIAFQQAGVIVYEYLPDGGPE